MLSATDANWKVRMQSVASVLGRLHDGKRRSAAAGARALRFASESVRGVAAGALGELGDASAVAALKRALRDPSSLVRDQAQMALESLHVPPPVAAAPPPVATAAERRLRPPHRQSPAADARSGARVEIGAITSRTSRLPGDLAERLRQTVAHNLAETPGAVLAKAGGNFVLDTSVTRLTRRTTDDSVEVECEVSLLLSRLPSKAIVMTTSGGATARVPLAGHTPEQDSGMIVDALEGAVTGGWANLAAFFSKTSARRSAPSDKLFASTPQLRDKSLLNWCMR